MMTCIESSYFEDEFGEDGGECQTHSAAEEEEYTEDVVYGESLGTIAQTVLEEWE